MIITNSLCDTVKISEQCLLKNKFTLEKINYLKKYTKFPHAYFHLEPFRSIKLHHAIVWTNMANSKVKVLQ